MESTTQNAGRQCEGWHGWQRKTRKGSPRGIDVTRPSAATPRRSKISNRWGPISLFEGMPLLQTPHNRGFSQRIAACFRSQLAHCPGDRGH